MSTTLEELARKFVASAPRCALPGCKRIATSEHVHADLSIETYCGEHSFPAALVMTVRQFALARDYGTLTPMAPRAFRPCEAGVHAAQVARAYGIKVAS